MSQPAHKTEGINRTQTMRFSPFVFTGKERDEETGYSYFGARYMDHELMTMWLSVDPMSDKYPSISPYAYCAWNPVKLVDPDGREVVILVSGKANNLGSLSHELFHAYQDDKGRTPHTIYNELEAYVFSGVIYGASLGIWKGTYTSYSTNPGNYKASESLLKDLFQ